MPSLNLLSDLTLVHQVMTSGSYRKASASTGLSHTTIGRRMRNLEQQYSMQLFEKRGRNMVPTCFASELIAKYHPQLTALNQTLADDLRKEQTSAIRIDQHLLWLFPETSGVFAALRRQEPLHHVVPTEPGGAEIVLHPTAELSHTYAHTVPVGNLIWAALAPKGLRYNLRQEVLFKPEGCPTVPSFAMVQPARQEVLSHWEAVRKAGHSQIGLCWLPINAGLDLDGLTEASHDDERIEQPVALSLKRHRMRQRAHEACFHTLVDLIQPALAQPISE